MRAISALDIEGYLEDDQGVRLPRTRVHDSALHSIRDEKMGESEVGRLVLQSHPLASLVLAP
jgi:hypothetical protein